MTTFKNSLTKQLLTDNNIMVMPTDRPMTFENGHYTDAIILQNGNVCKVQKLVCKHPKGTDRTYYGVTFKIDGKWHTTTYSNIMYVYLRDEQIPEGYDIDHINDCTNCDTLENLQCISRKDNIRKRKLDSDYFKKVKKQ